MAESIVNVVVMSAQAKLPFLRELWNRALYVVFYILNADFP